MTSFEIVPDSNSSIEEIHYSQIYITELEKQVFEAKTKELNSWKEQNVYLEEEEEEEEEEEKEEKTQDSLACQ